MLTQFMLLTKREMTTEFSKILTPTAVGQNLGITLMVGWMFFGVNSGLAQRDVRETIALFFYTTTLWTFTPLYAAIVAMGQRLDRAQEELKKGVYGPLTFVLAVTITDLIVQSVWPVVYSAVVFAMADVGRTPERFVNEVREPKKTKKTCVVRAFMCVSALFAHPPTCFHALHVLVVAESITVRNPRPHATQVYVVALCSATYHAVGRCVAIWVPDRFNAMAASTVFAQITLVAGGFYRTPSESTSWVGRISITTYAFVALINAEYEDDAAFRCTPQVSHGQLGRQSCYVEQSGIFDDMLRRGLMIGSHEATYHSRYGWMLFAFLFVSTALSAAGLSRRVSTHSYTKWGAKGRKPRGIIEQEEQKVSMQRRSDKQDIGVQAGVPRESVSADAGNVDSVSPVENRDIQPVKKTDSRITESDLL